MSDVAPHTVRSACKSREWKRDASRGDKQSDRHDHHEQDQVDEQVARQRRAFFRPRQPEYQRVTVRKSDGHVVDAISFVPAIEHYEWRYRNHSLRETGCIVGRQRDIDVIAVAKHAQQRLLEGMLDVRRQRQRKECLPLARRRRAPAGTPIPTRRPLTRRPTLPRRRTLRTRRHSRPSARLRCGSESPHTPLSTGVSSPEPRVLLDDSVGRFDTLRGGQRRQRQRDFSNPSRPLAHALLQHEALTLMRNEKQSDDLR